MPAAIGTTRWPFVDALRGWCLVMMAVNHFGGPLRLLSWQPFGFVSAAEGFFFLAGLMSGAVLVHGRYTDDQVARRHWAVSRFWRIYGAHVWALAGSAVLIAVVGTLVPEAVAAWRTPWGLLADAPAQAVVAGALFLYLPGPFDVLPLYCVFMLAAPWIVRSVESGRLLRVTCASTGLWLVSQVTLGRLLHWVVRVLPGTDAPDFDVFGWQLVFVGGTVAGCALPSRPDLEARLSPATWALAGATAAALFILRHAGVDAGFAGSVLTGRPALGVVRFLNFFLLAAILWKAPAGLKDALTWRPLALLGRHSLPVFGAHILLMVAVAPWRGAVAAAGPVWESAATLVFVVVLFVPAAIAERRRHARRLPVPVPERPGAWSRWAPTGRPRALRRAREREVGRDTEGDETIRA